MIASSLICVQHVHVDERQLFEKPSYLMSVVLPGLGTRRQTSERFLDWVRDERVWRFIVAVQTPGRVSQSCERGRAYLGRQRRSRSRQERIFRELGVHVPKGSEMEEITPPGEKPKSKQTKEQEDEEDEEAKEEKKRRRSLRYYDAFPDCGESFPDEHKVLLAHADKNIEAFSGDPRVEQYPRFLIPMVEYGREVEWFSDAISNVTTHDVLTGHEEEEAATSARG